MATVKEILIKIGVSVEGADKAEKDVGKTTDAAEDTDKKGSPKLKAFAKVAKMAFGGVAVAAAAASGAILAAGGAIFSFVNDQTAAMADIEDGVKKTGFATEEYQRLGHAAKLTGADIADLGKASKNINAGLLEASRGGKAYAQTLKDLGLEVSDLEGKSKTEQLGVFADALNKVDDQGRRSALAVAALGKSGMELLPFLDSGSAGIAELTGELDSVFTEEQISKAGAFQDDLDNLKATVGQAAGELAVALTPAISATVGVVKDFIAENDELIKQQLPKLMTMVAENATKLLPIVLSLAGTIADVVTEAEPLVDRFLIFTSGTLEKSLTGTKSALSLLLPIVLKLADGILTAVEGIEKAYNWAVTLGSIAGSEQNFGRAGSGAVVGSDGLTFDERRKQEAEENAEKERADKAAAKEREKAIAANEEKKLQSRKARLIRTTEGGATWSAEDQALAESVGLSRDDIRAAKKKPSRGRGGGRGKPKADEKPKDAHFGDFRDVLSVFMGKSPEEAVQALSSLEKGSMPADHRPETSINITNNITYNYDVNIPVSGASDPHSTAVEVRKIMRAEYKATAARMSHAVVR